MSNKERWFCTVEFTFDVDTEPSKPRHDGDAPIDFSNRAFLEGLRPRLDKAFPGNDGINWMLASRVLQASPHYERSNPMTETKHTKLPWIKSIQDPADNYAIILNAEIPQGRRAGLLKEIAQVNLTLGHAGAEGEANLNLILRAVNCHEDLVGVAEAAVACFENLRNIYSWDGREVGHIEDAINVMTALRIAIQKATP
ncbi:MAG: hypothetical protein ACYTEQ_27350 [Planctomycetota bacterium]|jgi:hypothetical protein